MKYNNENVFIVLPSVIEGEKILQIPSNITIALKDKNNNYTEYNTNEKFYFFNNNEVRTDKKYIGAFNNDYTTISNYIYSLTTDHIIDSDIYMKLIRSIKVEYKKEELKEIINLLREEIANIDYSKTKKLNKGKIRKKIKRR